VAAVQDPFPAHQGRIGADSEVRQDRLYLDTKSGTFADTVQASARFRIDRSDLLP
jgi:hypothetical protein